MRVFVWMTVFQVHPGPKISQGYLKAYDRLRSFPENCRSLPKITAGDAEFFLILFTSSFLNISEGCRRLGRLEDASSVYQQASVDSKRGKGVRNRNNVETRKIITTFTCVKDGFSQLWKSVKKLAFM